MQSRSALVIGGGIVGLSCALRLRQCGLRTTVVEADPAGQGASWGNAGHIAVEQVVPLASWRSIRSAPQRLFARGGALDVRELRRLLPWFGAYARAASPTRFRAGCIALRGLLGHALPAWQALLQEIGRRDLLQSEGHLLLWESSASARRGRAAWRAADTGSATLRDLSTAELEHIGSLLSGRPAGGIRFDGTAQVADPALVLQALRQAFTAAGGDCVHGRACALSIDNPQAAARLDDGRQLDADLLLVAAGVRSKPLLATLGIHAPLIAERGYHLHWPRHDWPAGLPPLVFEDRSTIVTRFASGLRAASFVEFAPHDAAPDPRKWSRLQAHADALGLPTAGEPQRWIGARPTLPDYLPAIGRSSARPNLLYAFGHQHLGLTLAPITAEIVAALASGRESPSPIAAFALERFHPSHGADRR